MKITPAENRRHLGDIINIIQKFRNEHEICGDEYCSCCGNDVKSTILQILKIIKVNIKYTENKTNSLIVYPSWSNSSKNIVNFDYVKSNYNFKKKIIYLFSLM